jgi:dCMP deaminase
MKVPPRKVPARNDFYMALALLYASKSKDPKTQCGCVIIGKDNKPLGFGYNGPPRQMKDTDINWDRPHKYPFIVHAEANAMRRVKLRSDLEGATLYVTAKPCSACMLEIADAEIKKVIYIPQKADKDSMLSNANISSDTDQISLFSGVPLEIYSGNLGWLPDRVAELGNLGFFDV